ncbi:MAG: hypothetical protein ACYC0X_32745 [Pirellulaceae bacterium]
MDYVTQANVYQIIAQTLRELGIPHAKFSIADTTILVQDGCYVGRSLVCGHVRVIMRSGGDRIEFRDQSGGILRVICPPRSIMQAKAA